MNSPRTVAAFLLIFGLLLGYFAYGSETADEGFLSRFPFRLGLDLSGGTHLVYRADTSETDSDNLGESLDALRDVIERRVNLFGVSEPLVQLEEASFGLPEPEHRLIIELPGVTDVNEAIGLIGATPFLEFRTERPEEERQALLDQYDALAGRQEAEMAKAEPDQLVLAQIAAEAEALADPFYIPTPLTGRFLERAVLQFGGAGGISEPYVLLSLDEEGTELFAELTRDNIGEIIAIYLDGQPIVQPVVDGEIPDGEAIIRGGFTPEEARTLAGRLNAGALPVSIELLSTQKVGATLGEEALAKGLRAGAWGLALVALFLIAYYRLPGIIAVLALAIYLSAMIALFKLIPVTLTSAGIAGLILSIGMAVDANILIFERTREELAQGLSTRPAIETGFARAWSSIRDGNISSLLTAAVLFWFGTSIIQGFAVTFGLGVLVSMWSAITITKRFLLALVGDSGENRNLFGKLKTDQA